jgi:hypothetical protein
MKNRKRVPTISVLIAGTVKPERGVNETGKRV